MNEIGVLLSRGWEIALGTWPLLVLAALLWLVMVFIALRRIAAQQRGGMALALLAGGWAVAAGLALSPELAHSLLVQPTSSAPLGLLAGLLLLGLLACKPLLARR